jgi:hypothetical protein
MQEEMTEYKWMKNLIRDNMMLLSNQLGIKHKPKVEKYKNADLDFLEDEDESEEEEEVASNESGKSIEMPKAEEMSERLLFFDSDFESGNLDMVALTNCDDADEYDLMMRLDTNSRTHNNWFYYSVRIRSD